MRAGVEQSSLALGKALPARTPTPSQDAARRESAVRLADALAQLPDDQRAAVDGHHLQGRPLADIAEELGRSRGAVGALLLRAMKKLRWLLEGPNPDEP